MSNPLAPTEVLAAMADAIPTHAVEDTTSDVSASYEVIALFVHACMSILGFRLLGFDEDKCDDSHVTKLAPRLDAKWNATFGAATFVYQNPHTSQIHVLRIDRVGQLAEVRATTEGSDKILRFSKPLRDVVKSAALPIRIAINADKTEDRSKLVDHLREAFVSEDAMIDLAATLKVEIIQHLGGASSAGKQNADDRDAAEAMQRELREQPLPPALAQRQDRHGNPQPQPQSDAAAPLDPFGAAPQRPIPSGDFPPPGFEDPYDLNRMPDVGGAMPGRNPFNIGSGDLHPAGLDPSSGLYPFLGPGRGFDSGPASGSGGMHPTFNDPLFGQHGQEQDPRHPPGARWDPLGPPGPKFGGPGRGPGGYSSGPFGGGDIM